MSISLNAFISFKVIPSLTFPIEPRIIDSSSAKHTNSSKKYDKRYEAIFKPAIEKADLKPYRVDRDPAVSIPINDIKTKIKNSDVCLAEITDDNPNVWLELGYAIASDKEVVLVCSDERGKEFPFDIQHRSIIIYKTESTQDFDKLRKNITKKLEAILEKEDTLDCVVDIDQPPFLVPVKT
ncbi:hypothetical protein J7L67_07840 [bacterium]|nr:hypothetical protein [bacterium]